MDKMKYALLTEVFGRWKADILENLLRAEEIDVVLMQETIIGSPQENTFAQVKIYVPKESLERARNLLNSFNEAGDHTKES